MQYRPCAQFPHFLPWVSFLNSHLSYTRLAWEIRGRPHDCPPSLRIPRHYKTTTFTATTANRQERSPSKSSSRRSPAHPTATDSANPAAYRIRSNTPPFCTGVALVLLSDHLLKLLFSYLIVSLSVAVLNAVHCFFFFNASLQIPLES